MKDRIISLINNPDSTILVTLQDKNGKLYTIDDFHFLMVNDSICEIVYDDGELGYAWSSELIRIEPEHVRKP
jgi:hypothetical protein